MWWRRFWFSLKGKAGIPGQTEGCPATSIGPRVPPLGSLQQRVARALTTTCAPSKDVTVAAVASRGLDKAEAFAREVNIPRALGSYADLLTDPDIDAVYVPLPKSMHAQCG